MLTKIEKNFLRDVSMFLSGRIRGKGKNEEVHNRKVDYLVRNLGCERFMELLMKEIRKIGEAGPCFMHRALLEINRQLLEINERYRREFVNPRLYDAIEAIPAINFAYYVGANIPKDQLVPFDVNRLHLPPKNKEEV